MMSAKLPEAMRVGKRRRFPAGQDGMDRHMLSGMDRQDMTRHADTRGQRLRNLLWDDRFFLAILILAGIAGAFIGPLVGPVGWYIVGFGGLFALWQIHWADRLGLSALSHFESKAAHTLEEEERRARSRACQPDADRIAQALAADVETERRGREVKTTLASAMAMLGLAMALVHG